jgi:hypothetical protein
MDGLPPITAEKLKPFLHNGVDQFAEQTIEPVNAASSGRLAPADAVFDRDHASVSIGVREMACRLNRDAGRFDRAAGITCRRVGR